MEESNLFFDGTRQVDKTWVEGFYIATREVFEEPAEGDEVVGLG